MTSLDEPRPNFRGVMGIDAVTGRMQPQYPRWKTNVKVASVPIVIIRYSNFSFLLDVLCFNSVGVLLYVRRLFGHVNFILGRRTSQTLRF